MDDKYLCLILALIFIGALYYVLTRKQNHFELFELAQNDAVVVSNPTLLRPFNDINSRFSHAMANEASVSEDAPDNTFFKLWAAEKALDQEDIINRTNLLNRVQPQCVDFQNVNQCMATCTNSNNCDGFYIEKPVTDTSKGRCCMIINPNNKELQMKHSFSETVDNRDFYALKTNNVLVKEIGDKPVFTRFGADGFNDTYSIPLTREDCQHLCPKCVNGRCPENYRCTDMVSNPRFNNSCRITNENRYDESLGRIFDGPEIPYIDEELGFNEYAGYRRTPDAPRPVHRKKTLLIDPHGNMVLSRENIASVNNDTVQLKSSPLTDSHDLTPTISSEIIEDRIESFEPNLIEIFDPWVNRIDMFDPYCESFDRDFIAIRGENSFLSLHDRCENKRESNDTEVF